MSEDGPLPAGRIAVVTGGARNIGRAIVLALAADGVDVVVNAMESGGEAEAAAAEARSHGVRATTFLGDIRDPDAVKRMFEHALETLGPVSVLINNAAVRSHRPIDQLDWDEWSRVLAVNLNGTFLCTRAAIGHMRRVGWGRIVNIVGVSGQAGAHSAAHIAASKAGVIGLTKALAVELAAEQITVNAVSPGVIETVRRLQSAAVTANPGAGWSIPMNRLGTPSECAAAVRFLVSREASYVTGVTLSVNGGAYIS